MLWIPVDLCDLCCLVQFINSCVSKNDSLSLGNIYSSKMEQDGVGDIELDVNHLSDTELAQKLRNLGADIGPVTGMFFT